MISKSFANAVNAAVFGGVPLGIDTWYFGFSTKPIDNDGNIPAGGEPTNTGYTRVAMDNTSTFFSTPTYSATAPISVVTNNRTISMLIVAGQEQLASYWFLSRYKTGNTADVWGSFTTPISFGAGSQVVIPAGNMLLSINNP